MASPTQALPILLSVIWPQHGLPMRVRAAIHALAVLVVAATTFAIGLNYAQDKTGSYYQQDFAPAVMQACGLGFFAPKEKIAPLTDFLEERIDYFDCGEMPQAKLGKPDVFAKAHRYLFELVSLVWRFTGPNWPSVEILSVAFFALAALGSYALFALFTPPLFAAAVSIILSLSFINIEGFLNFRDYAKIPFILLGSAALIFVFAKADDARQVIAGAGLAGVIFGIGAGFRMDILPYGLVAILALVVSGRKSLLKTPQTNLLAACLFAALFVLLGSSTIFAVSGEANTFHVILLGLADQFTQTLGMPITQTSWVPAYRDEYIAAIVSAYGSEEEPVLFSKPGYDINAFYYLMEIIYYYPYDIYNRILYSVHNSLNLSPRGFYGFDKERLIGEEISEIQSKIYLGEIAFVCLIYRLSRISLSKAFVFLFLGFFLAALPVLQFAPRHYSHNQFFAILLLVVAGATVWRSTAAIKAIRVPNFRMGRLPIPSAMTSLAILTILLPPLILKPMQAMRVRNLLMEYDNLSFQPLNAFNQGVLEKGASWQALLVRVQVTPENCSQSIGALIPMPEEGILNVNYGVALDLKPDAPYNFYFPLLLAPQDDAAGRFRGIAIGSSIASCVDVQLARVPAGMPLVRTVAPHANANSQVWGIATLSFPPGSEVTADDIRRELDQPLKRGVDNLLQTGFSFVKEGVEIEPRGISVKTDISTCCGYLFQTNEGAGRSDRVMTVWGELERGTIAIGTLRGSSWYGQAEVGRPGFFMALMVLPDEEAQIVASPIDAGRLELKIEGAF